MSKQVEMVTEVVRLSDIRGTMCACDGCDACFERDMPKGWSWLTLYWSKRPHLHYHKIPVRDVLRDAALCPEHTRALDGVLKNTGRDVLGPFAGSA